MKLSIIALFFLTGCHVSYLVKSGYHQARIFARQIPLEEAQNLPSLNEDQRRKILLTSEVMKFIESDLRLKTHNNYSTYSQLDGPYVTYAVSAAQSFKLEPFLWHFPIVGNVPYKGYFSEDEAKLEAQNLSRESLDTFVRGVSAYSTLGWFRDPLLSSMLRYDDPDLVNTLIHETIHANLYIKSSADFNERLATFLGNLGTEIFYNKKLGPKNLILKSILDEQEDIKLFSAFITQEIAELKTWYLTAEKSLPLKEARLLEIQVRFKKAVQPKLKTKSYTGFATEKLNNAKLLAYGTYMADLDDFQKVYEKLGSDFGKLMEYCKNLESSKNPEAEIKKARGF